MVRDNLQNIRARIGDRAAACGRAASEIVLVCVVKEARNEDVEEALGAGVTDIGENRVQDALIKNESLKAAGPVRWHFIGHLQTNKVKKAVGFFDMIHSVDSLHLAESIQREAKKLNKMQSVLVQVNVSGEDTKFGISPEGAEDLIRSMGGMKNLMLLGLMTIAPYSDDPEDSRPHFRRLRELRDKYSSYDCGNIRMKHLSMGMSGDFETAIEEGADMLRIGSAIFRK